MLPKRGGQEGSGQISVPPPLYNYFQTSRKTSANFFRQRLFQIFSTFPEFIASSLGNWSKIWLWQHNKGCGKYHAGNLPQLEPYSYKKVFEQIYLSKAKGVGCNLELFAHHSLPASICWVALSFPWAQLYISLISFANCQIRRYVKKKIGKSCFMFWNAKPPLQKWKPPFSRWLNALHELFGISFWKNKIWIPLGSCLRQSMRGIEILLEFRLNWVITEVAK